MELENDKNPFAFTIKQLLQSRATKAIKDAFNQDIEAEVAACVQENFGHYQCNSALKLAKILGKNPRDVAQSIIDCFDIKQETLIEKFAIAGPGFINITLDTEFLSNRLQEASFDSHLGATIPQEKKRIIVEFSSPNIAKELHVGHLRSTIIGDCLARLFEFMDQDVLRLNHIGDWGTQFGMLIAYLEEYEPDVISGDKKSDLSTLMQWYKDSKKKFDEDEKFKKKSQQKVVHLQSGEEKTLFAWRAICDISRKAFHEIYDLLDIKILERGESFYNPQLNNIVDDLDKKGHIRVSDGAKCVFLDGFINRDGDPLPLMVQKSDGGFNYDTTDMAAMHHRIFEEKADRIIIVTDAGQSLHFQMIFAAAKKAGYFDKRDVVFDHVPFGLVLGSDGKKFKTRSGDIEKLIDLLKEAVLRAKKIMSDRLPDLEPHKVEALSKTLGIDAVKYADLSCHRQKDYTFSYDKMLKFEGNTAAFLLYAYVRVLGIKRKVGSKIDSILTTAKIDLKHPSEVSLGLHLLRFGEVLEMVARDLLPNRLTDYLYELAEKFHAFFRDCRVESSKEQDARLALCEVTRKILKKGLEILGLKTLNRM